MVSAPALTTAQPLHIGYGRNVVARDLRFSVQPGEVFAILGSNGVGKSTLVKTIGGLIQPIAGELQFLGSDLAGVSPRQRVALGVSTVLEGRRIFRELTVRQNLQLSVPRGTRVAQAHERMDRLVEQDEFEALGARMGQRAGNLSGGQQQLLAMAMGFMAQPRLLVLDEPTMGLSPSWQSSIAAAIEAVLRDGAAVLLCEQSVRFAKRVATRVSVLRGGILHAATTADLEAGLDLFVGSRHKGAVDDLGTS